MPGAGTFIYVAEAACGLVKIGVSRTPQNRMSTINLHSPVACRLIACWPGCKRDEDALHRLFVAERVHGEWFRLVGPVADFVAKVRGRGVAAVVPFEAITLTLQARDERDAARRAARAERARSVWADPVRRAQWARSRARRSASTAPQPAPELREAVS